MSAYLLVRLRGTCHVESMYGGTEEENTDSEVDESVKGARATATEILISFLWLLTE